MLPGIPPTGKRVEIPLLIVIQFDGDQMAREHLYRDQAPVLVQGMLAPAGLPVVGAESGRSIIDHSIPLSGSPQFSREQSPAPLGPLRDLQPGMLFEG